MSDRAAYTLAAAILAAGALVAGAVTFREAGRFSSTETGTLLDTATGQLFLADPRAAESGKRWYSFLPPPDTGPAEADPAVSDRP